MKLILKNEVASLTLVKEDMTEADLIKVFSIISEKEPAQITVDAHKLTEAVKETLVKDEIKSRPRAITLLNSERKLNEPIESVARIQRENVKVYVNCPQCYHEGDQCTYRGNRYTKCKECGTELFNRPAGETWGDVDENGYEYMATTGYVKPWEGQNG